MPDLPVPQSNGVVERLAVYEVLDSRGHPTVAAVVSLTDGTESEALAPTGASTGQFERPELRDTGATRYSGLGVAAAVAWGNDVLAPKLVGVPVHDVDTFLDDGPGNIAVATSLAAVRAAASSEKLPLWRYLAAGGTARIPVPMINIFSGGRHAEGGGQVQDFLAVPLGATTVAEAIEAVWQVRRRAVELTEARQGKLLSMLVADEGGIALADGGDEAPLEVLTQAISDTGLDVGIAIDIAATQIVDLATLQPQLTRWRERFPIVSIEDPAADDDWDTWVSLTEQLAPLQVVGDDLFATDAERLRHGAKLGAANTLLVKPNQAGTLTASRLAFDAARSANYRTVVSARSGDTEDDFIADLATGWDSGQIKIGSLQRSERLSKYNRLLRLESVDGLPYIGWASAVSKGH